MRAYVINLDSAADRWRAIEEAFAATKLDLCRVPAVDGLALTMPHADFSEAVFHRIHGRSTNLREVGCYFSHVRALRVFLESGEAHGLICEDDIALDPNLEKLLAAALRFAPQWNILRLSGLRTGTPARLAGLADGYALYANFGRMKGTGAYLVDRAAARAFSDFLLPMKLPFDHALDREWRCGLKAASVLPFPISQTKSKFRSSIQQGGAHKLSRWRRCRTTYPFQIYNELHRWFSRSIQYGQFRRVENKAAAPAMLD